MNGKGGGESIISVLKQLLIQRHNFRSHIQDNWYLQLTIFVTLLKYFYIVGLWLKGFKLEIFFLKNYLLLYSFYSGLCWVLGVPAGSVVVELNPLACGILVLWDHALCNGRWILNRWTTREVPEVFLKSEVNLLSVTCTAVWADPVCFATCVCSHRSTPTSVQLSWPWMFLPPGLCKDSFLSLGSSPQGPSLTTF